VFAPAFVRVVAGLLGQHDLALLIRRVPLHAT
jgi:hypothetical protein